MRQKKSFQPKVMFPIAALAKEARSVMALFSRQRFSLVDLKVHRHAVLGGSVGVVAELSEGLPQPRTQSIHAVWHVALRHESML